MLKVVYSVGYSDNLTEAMRDDIRGKYVDEHNLYKCSTKGFRAYNGKVFNRESEVLYDFSNDPIYLRVKNPTKSLTLPVGQNSNRKKVASKKPKQIDPLVLIQCEIDGDIQAMKMNEAKIKLSRIPEMEQDISQIKITIEAIKESASNVISMSNSEFLAKHADGYRRTLYRKIDR